MEADAGPPGQNQGRAAEAGAPAVPAESLGSAALAHRLLRWPSQGDKSAVVTESYLDDSYQQRDENGRLLKPVIMPWWGAAPAPVEEEVVMPSSPSSDTRESELAGMVAGLEAS